MAGAAGSSVTLFRETDPQSAVRSFLEARGRDALSLGTLLLANFRNAAEAAAVPNEDCEGILRASGGVLLRVRVEEFDAFVAESSVARALASVFKNKDLYKAYCTSCNAYLRKTEKEFDAWLDKEFQEEGGANERKALSQSLKHSHKQFMNRIHQAKRRIRELVGRKRNVASIALWRRLFLQIQNTKRLAAANSCNC
jgi:hypothetical protein